MEWCSRDKAAMLMRGMVPPMLSAALLVLAFPPFDWPLLAWVALVPLLLQIGRSTTLASFFQGLLTGALFYLVFMWWAGQIAEANPWNFIVLVLALGFFFGLFAVAARLLLTHRPSWAPLTLPTLWCAIEYLRSNIGFLSQTFGILGYSQYQMLPAAGIAAFTGVYGVSFLVAATNAVVATLIRPRARAGDDTLHGVRRSVRAALPLLGTITLLLGWFAWQATAGRDAAPGRSLSVAVVQGNAAADNKTGYERYLQEVLPVYERLTRTASGATLVIWPSSSVPGILPGDRAMVERLGRLSQQSRAHLLIGAAGLDKFNAEQARQQRIANSAFLFAPDGGLLGRYDKIRLLPFDEYLPARGLIPWPAWIVEPGMTDHYPGKTLTVFEAASSRFGVQICFENMFPDQVRELARRGAEFVVGQTNEAYTASPAGHYQNLAYYVFRAIENRLPVLRSSTTGVSCIIDQSGRIVGSVRDAAGREVGVAGVATATIALSGERSFYTRYGDLFAQGCLALSVALVVAGTIVNIYRARQPAQRTERREIK